MAGELWKSGKDESSHNPVKLLQVVGGLLKKLEFVFHDLKVPEAGFGVSRLFWPSVVTLGPSDGLLLRPLRSGGTFAEVDGT